MSNLSCSILRLDDDISHMWFCLQKLDEGNCYLRHSPPVTQPSATDGHSAEWWPLVKCRQPAGHYPLMVNVMGFIIIWSRHRIYSYISLLYPSMCSVCVYFSDWRSAPPTSCLGKMSSAAHWMLPRVHEIVLSLAGHFKLFAGHLIGFNYDSSPDIFKFCWTCPASPANFAYSDCYPRSCDYNIFSIQHSHPSGFILTRVQGFYPQSHPWSQDLYRNLQDNLRVTSGQSPCLGPGKLRWLLVVVRSMAIRTANAVVGASSRWGNFVGWSRARSKHSHWE